MEKEFELIENFIVPDAEAELLPITEEHPAFNMAMHQVDPMDLSQFGYLEEEYLISGLANVYAWNGTTGRPRIKGKNAPYCTRIIVRKPADPKRFSGHVMVDMMHGGGGVDNPNIGWGSAFEHIMEQGDGYVGMSIAGSTFQTLKTFDPERYEKLSMQNPFPPETRKPQGNMGSSPDQQKANRGGGMPDDPETEKGMDMDIMSQLSAMIKRGKPGTPFAGYHAKYTYILGVTFGEIPCYVSAVMPYSLMDDGSPIYDGAMVFMSGRAGNLNREEGILDWDDPRTKCGGKVPVVRLQTGGDLRGTRPHPLWASMFRSENTDEPGNIGRTYEVAGTSLKYCARADVRVFPGYSELEKAGKDPHAFDDSGLRGNRNDGLQCSMIGPIIAGVYRNMKDWAVSGTPLPKAEYITTVHTYPDTDIVLDEHGNALGGVRTHYVNVPIATYTETGEILPFSAEKVRKLYGTKEHWLELVKADIDRMLSERWILDRDADFLYREAQESPWPEA